MGDLFHIPLATYGHVIGWINVIITIITFILLKLAFDYFDDVFKFVCDHYHYLHDGFKTLVAAALYIVLICTLVNAISSALLIYGTYMQRYEFMIPWLVVWTFTICFCLVSSWWLSLYGLFFALLACIMYYPIYLLFIESYTASLPPESPESGLEEDSTTL